MQPPSGTSAGQPLSAASQDTFSLAASIDELVAALAPGGESVRGSDDGSTAYTGKPEDLVGRHVTYLFFQHASELGSATGSVLSTRLCQILPILLDSSMLLDQSLPSVQGLLSKINRVLACTREEQIILYPIYDMTGGNSYIWHDIQVSACMGQTAAVTAGDNDMPYRVVRRMKALLLEAQTQQAKAEADCRIAAAEAAALSSKIG